MQSSPRFSASSAIQLTLAMHLGLLVLLAAVHRQLRGNHWYDASALDAFRIMTGLCAGLFVAQVCFVGGWVAFSGRSSALRGAALLLFVPLLAAVQSQVFNDTKFFAWWFTNWEDSAMRYTTWVVELTLLAALTATSGFGLRLAGFRVLSPDVPNAEPAWQLRLVDLGGWIVVLSLLLASGHWLREYGWSWRRAQAALEWSRDRSFLAKGEFVLFAILLATGLLWPKSPRWGIGLMLVLPLAFSLFDDWWLGPLGLNTNDSVTYFHRKIFSHDTLAVMYFTFCLALGGTLLVLRDRGYRLSWRRPFY